MGAKEFDFDDEIVNSQAYRQALARLKVSWIKACLYAATNYIVQAQVSTSQHEAPQSDHQKALTAPGEMQIILSPRREYNNAFDTAANSDSEIVRPLHRISTDSSTVVGEGLDASNGGMSSPTLTESTFCEQETFEESGGGFSTTWKNIEILNVYKDEDHIAEIKNVHIGGHAPYLLEDSEKNNRPLENDTTEDLTSAGEPGNDKLKAAVPHDKNRVQNPITAWTIVANVPELKYSPRTADVQAKARDFQAYVRNEDSEEDAMLGSGSKKDKASEHRRSNNSSDHKDSSEAKKRPSYGQANRTGVDPNAGSSYNRSNSGGHHPIESEDSASSWDSSDSEYDGRVRGGVRNCSLPKLERENYKHNINSSAQPDTEHRRSSDTSGSPETLLFDRKGSRYAGSRQQAPRNKNTSRPNLFTASSMPAANHLPTDLSGNMHLPPHAIGSKTARTKRSSLHKVGWSSPEDSESSDDLSDGVPRRSQRIPSRSTEAIPPGPILLPTVSGGESGLSPHFFAPPHSAASPVRSNHLSSPAHPLSSPRPIQITGAQHRTPIPSMPQGTSPRPQSGFSTTRSNTHFQSVQEQSEPRYPSTNSSSSSRNAVPIQFQQSNQSSRDSPTHISRGFHQHIDIPPNRLPHLNNIHPQSPRSHAPQSPGPLSFQPPHPQSPHPQSPHQHNSHPHIPRLHSPNTPRPSSAQLQRYPPAMLHRHQTMAHSPPIPQSHQFSHSHPHPQPSPRPSTTQPPPPARMHRQVTAPHLDTEYLRRHPDSLREDASSSATPSRFNDRDHPEPARRSRSNSTTGTLFSGATALFGMDLILSSLEAL